MPKLKDLFNRKMKCPDGLRHGPVYSHLRLSAAFICLSTKQVRVKESIDFEVLVCHRDPTLTNTRVKAKVKGAKGPLHWPGTRDREIKAFGDLEPAQDNGSRGNDYGLGAWSSHYRFAFEAVRRPLKSASKTTHVVFKVRVGEDDLPELQPGIDLVDDDA